MTDDTKSPIDQGAGSLTSPMVNIKEPYQVYYGQPFVVQWAEKQDTSSCKVKTNEDRLGEPIGPITMEETLIRAGKGIMERLIFEEKRNWHKREKNMIGMGKQGKKPRRLTGWEISTERSPVVKPPDDTERKEAKSLGHRLTPSPYTFNPHGFMSPPDGWVSTGTPCDDMPQWMKDAKMVMDKKDGKRLGDIDLKSTVGTESPTGDGAGSLYRPGGIVHEAALKSEQAKQEREPLVSLSVISDEELRELRVINNFIHEHGVLTGRNTILEECNTILLEALKGLYDATDNLDEAYEAAKRAIEMCGGD
jgi:hypothetical protein